MNDPDQRRPRSFRTLGVILGTVAVAGLAVVSFGSFAGADDTGGSATTAPDATARPHRQLTDTQKQCLAARDVTLPERPADGTKPTPPTDDQRAALKAAAEACGLPVRGPGLGGPGFGGRHGNFSQLTDEQKQCLADHRLALGQKPAEGSHDSFRAAAEACGLTIPAPGARPTI